MNLALNRPSVAPALVSQWIEELAPRFRRRLEAQPRLADEWSWSQSDSRWCVAASPDATVTLHPSADGSITSREQLACTCLLSPKCLHLAAVVVALPVGEGAPAEVAPVVEKNQEKEEEEEDVPPSFALTRRQAEAVAGAGRAATAMLKAGAGAFGLVIEGELLRAAHSCRIVGLHRLAAALVRLVERGREYRDQRPEFRLEALAGDLHDVLSTVWRLRDGSATVHLVGTARRSYRPVHSMRLCGIFTEAIASAGGFAGVVTYLLDTQARIWSTADVTPGEAVRCQVAYYAPVLLGEVGLSHAALSRAGVRAQAMSASVDRRLGSGREVRAFEAEGASWTDPPLASLWEVPLGKQLDWAWSARELPLDARPAGSDLLFIRARVQGVDEAALIVETEAGLRLRLTAPSDHAELPYLDNLRLLGSCPGMMARWIGRVRPGAPRALQILAVGADTVTQAGVEFPSDWRQHANLGLDRLQRAYLPDAGPRPFALRRSENEAPIADPLDVVRRRVLQIVSGGAATVAQPAWSGIESDERTLERAQLRTAAGLLRSLRFAVAQGSNGLAASLLKPADPLARAWTAMREYERHASARLERLRWGS